jgi:hypothetical protein
LKEFSELACAAVREQQVEGWAQGLTEAGIGVLGLHSLAPVLAEEHVRGEGTLGGVVVLLVFARGLFDLLGGAVLLEKGQRAAGSEV